MGDLCHPFLVEVEDAYQILRVLHLNRVVVHDCLLYQVSAMVFYLSEKQRYFERNEVIS
jgi:hypothetical protein